MNLSSLKKIHMIGIKGTGMANLARFFAQKGVAVTGSDVPEEFATTRDTLRHSGITVMHGFSPSNIPGNAQLIIYSTAYNAERNEEVAAAQESRIKTVSYPEVIADLFRQHFGLAICGSHGKTTTTAWLGFIMIKAGLKPNVIVGSNVPQLENENLAGDSDYFVLEADEYQRKLDMYDPKAVILLNIDYDHPDTFPTLESYAQVFTDFIQKIPKKGFLVANFDDLQVRKLAAVNTHASVISYGLDNPEADYSAENITQDGGRQFFGVRYRADGESMDLGEFSISLSGCHNISNALAVIAASIEFGIELADIRGYLSEFTGASRRMELIGEYGGASVIDDYAHHPAEIKATLAGARGLFGRRRLIAVFHPHTFTRTKALLNDFAASFADADIAVMLDIYGSAREEQGGVHSRELVAKIEEFNRSQGNPKQMVLYIPDHAGCLAYLREHSARGDVILLLGAGDVFRIGEQLVAENN